ncbi:hypothetical protein QQS21_004781 [Conoideocrella luteorostrata]|uniref:Uncharacterized protein n=1 Tax=Conoideocrella luteorostrata TaxID=1105319 RepID=A0AAJ0CQS5_9HYPO|nr:hypothetical protein QQS21_004781 [Conoideocrella luteorostrata]
MDAEAFAMPGCTTPPNDRTRRPSSNLLSKEDNEASEVDSTTIRPHVASHGTKKLSPKPGEGPFVPDEVVLTDSKSPVSQRDRHNSHAKPFQLEKLIQDTSQPVFDDPKRVDSGYGGSHHSFSLTNPSVETEQSGDVILNRQKQSGLETKDKSEIVYEQCIRMQNIRIFD